MTTEKSQDILLNNRYRLIHQVGKGGMALVYEAYDEMLDRPVAVKLLRDTFSADLEFRERFKQEARAAANLAHPNIVTVHDFGVDQYGIFIVMEYVAGKDLKAWIREKKIYSIAEGIPLLIQACAGLGYAHRAGIVHCDVKPQNLIVSNDGRLKITDFGIARAMSTLEPEVSSDVVWGSPYYLSPEQSSGTHPTPASDVYSLGIVMYEMFTGSLPFEAKTTDELVKLQQTSLPTDPKSLIPDFPESLSQIILKTLSKEPSSRYRTADQLGRVLSTFFDHSSLNPKSIPPPLPAAPSYEMQNPKTITQEDYPPTAQKSVDWKLTGLELLCLLLVGGLIPFWLYVWFTIRPLLG
jgi:eukaryotic-like serine/threonine-protein kinase